ncbi:hypothetical protein WN51_07762 [Melipona quadrifasciata]|uniref:Uncharacterized protein n=1 Tax=Melipona quadrifasciata TaxID=166423 RepID=A0A0M9A809_9HYME|nr:hypothetical protein WN51_07762 [Melipona quadrifasciata]
MAGRAKIDDFVEGVTKQLGRIKAKTCVKKVVTYYEDCTDIRLRKLCEKRITQGSFVREDFSKLDDNPAEALALISLSFFLIVDSFLLNDVKLSPDFNRSAISNFSSNDINLLSLSFMEIFGVAAGKYSEKRLPHLKVSLKTKVTLIEEPAWIAQKLTTRQTLTQRQLKTMFRYGNCDNCQRPGIGDDIEEPVMKHEDATTKKLQEFLDEEHQETQRGLKPTVQELPRERSKLFRASNENKSGKLKIALITTPTRGDDAKVNVHPCTLKDFGTLGCVVCREIRVQLRIIQFHKIVYRDTRRYKNITTITYACCSTKLLLSVGPFYRACVSFPTGTSSPFLVKVPQVQFLATYLQVHQFSRYFAVHFATGVSSTFISSRNSKEEVDISRCLTPSIQARIEPSGLLRTTFPTSVVGLSNPKGCTGSTDRDRTRTRPSPFSLRNCGGALGALGGFCGKPTTKREKKEVSKLACQTRDFYISTSLQPGSPQFQGFFPKRDNNCHVTNQNEFLL